MEPQLRNLSIFHFGFSWNNLMKSLCRGFKWHWDAHLLSLPLSSWTWLMFLDFKLVKIYQTLNTIVEVIGGLKGLSRSSSTWRCIVFLLNQHFHVKTTFQGFSQPGSESFYFGQRSEFLGFPLYGKKKIYPSISSCFVFWVMSLPFISSSFMFSFLHLLWGFPSLCSCPLSSGWSIGIPLCSCIYWLNLWPMNLTAAGESLTFPWLWLLG